METHPFGSFVPFNARYLLLGSFTGKLVDGYDWFYASKRNQFWPILEEVYEVKLRTRKQMQQLFTTLGMAIADIIYQCDRKRCSNLDANLTNIVYAVEDIAHILKNNRITTIFFTSRFVEGKFRRIFKEAFNWQPGIELVTLPSPSPRYAVMTKPQKIKRYKEMLPKLV